MLTKLSNRVVDFVPFLLVLSKCRNLVLCWRRRVGKILRRMSVWSVILREGSKLNNNCSAMKSRRKSRQTRVKLLRSPKRRRCITQLAFLRLMDILVISHLPLCRDLINLMSYQGEFDSVVTVRNDHLNDNTLITSKLRFFTKLDDSLKYSLVEEP